MTASSARLDRREVRAARAASAKPELELNSNSAPGQQPKLKRKWFIGPKIDPNVLPDHTHEGLLGAILKAMDATKDIDYIDSDMMCEDLEYRITEALRFPRGIHVTLQGHNRALASRPRLIVQTDWGHREIIDVTCGYRLFSGLTKQ